MNGFVAFVKKNIELTTEEELKLDTCYQVRATAKNEFLVKEGELCKQFFFVETGLVRQYSVDAQGKEHILHFASESWFIGDRESAFFNQPAKYFIQCLEPCNLIVFDNNFTEVAQKIPLFSDLQNRLLQNHVRHLQKRINQLLSASAEERYLDFIDMYPDVLQRVPQTMVAAYLGIAPESLSRVRKELMHK